MSDPYHDAFTPRPVDPQPVPASNGVPRMPFDDAETQLVMRYVQKHAPAVWANAMLAVFAPGYEAKTPTARGRGKK